MTQASILKPLLSERQECEAAPRRPTGDLFACAGKTDPTLTVSRCGPILPNVAAVTGVAASTTVSPELLGSMKSGKRRSVVFQNLNKENVNFAFVLSGFAEGYDKIN